MTAGWAIFKTVRNYFCQYMGNGRRRQRRRLLRRHYTPRPWYLTNYRPTFDSSSKTEKNIRNPKKKATKTKLKNSKQQIRIELEKTPPHLYVTHNGSERLWLRGANSDRPLPVLFVRKYDTVFINMTINVNDGQTDRQMEWMDSDWLYSASLSDWCLFFWGLLA